MRILYFILTLACAQSAWSQAFIMNQFFQPSVRLNTEYVPDFLGNPSHRATYVRSNLNLIMPVKSKLGVKIDWSELLKVKKWKDFNGIARIKMHQIFWNIRPQAAWLQYQSPNGELQPFGGKSSISAGLSTGITGMYLLKKMRILFFTVNVGFHEQIQSLQRFRIHPSANLLFGVAQPRGLYFVWYYGLYVGYGNGQILPSPFIGIQARIAPKLWLNITLPVQLRLGYAFSKKFQLDFSAGLSSWGSGFWAKTPDVEKRNFFSSTQLRAAFTGSIRFNKQTRLYVEAGCFPYRRWTFGGWSLVGKQEPMFEKPQLAPTFYASISLFYAFKKSFLSSTIDGLIMF